MRLNQYNAKVPTRFNREVRFEVAPRFEPLEAHTDQNRLERLKVRLLKPVLDEVNHPGLRKQLSLAANEAAAIAFTTGFPLLVLPALFDEKREEVHEYVRRQEEIQQTSEYLAETIL